MNTQLDPPPAPESPTSRRPRVPTFGLSATQLVATGLAATTATFAASYLGIAGTVIGAALASVLTATGNAVYGQTLRRTRERVMVAVPVTRAPRRGTDDEPPELPSPVPGPVGAAPWRRIAFGAVSIFVVLMAVVTSVELVAGRPVSDLARGDSGGGTSFFGHQTVRTTTVPATTPTVYVTVTPKVVVTTPTVTRTAPARTATVTPTATATAPATPTRTGTATPSGSPSASGSSTP